MSAPKLRKHETAQAHCASVSDAAAEFACLLQPKKTNGAVAKMSRNRERPGPPGTIRRIGVRACGRSTAKPASTRRASGARPPACARADGTVFPSSTPMVPIGRGHGFITATAASARMRPIFIVNQRSDMIDSQPSGRSVHGGRRGGDTTRLRNNTIIARPPSGFRLPGRFR